MASRSYREHCGIARALDRVGERWTLLLVRELLYLGPRRFADLRRALPGLAPNLLTRRLRDLEADGLVVRSILPAPASVRVYRLTPRGRALEPVLQALWRWGRAALGDAREAGAVRPELPVMALRAAFRPEDAAGVHETWELQVDDVAIQAVVEDGRMTLRPGMEVTPDVTVTTDAATLADVVAGRLDVSDALGSGAMRIEGEPAALGHFMRIVAHNPGLRPAG